MGGLQPHLWRISYGGWGSRLENISQSGIALAKERMPLVLLRMRPPSPPNCGLTSFDITYYIVLWAIGFSSFAFSQPSLAAVRLWRVCSGTTSFSSLFASTMTEVVGHMGPDKDLNEVGAFRSQLNHHATAQVTVYTIRMPGD